MTGFGVLPLWGCCHFGGAGKRYMARQHSIGGPTARVAAMLLAFCCLHQMVADVCAVKPWEA